MNYDKKMINRINRIQGQLNGIIKMMEEGKDCKDVHYTNKCIKEFTPTLDGYHYS